MSTTNEMTFTVKLRCGKRTNPSVDVGFCPSRKLLRVGENLYCSSSIAGCLKTLTREWLKDQVRKNQP
jgi:hypothetical protein